VSGYLFISYAHEDREFVDKLAHFLRGEGIEVWYDVHLTPGKRWDDAILTKIEQCAAFVVVMSHRSNESPSVIDEFDYAKDRNRDLMPISLDGTRFFGIGHIQIEILTGGELPSHGFLGRLKVLVGEGELLFEMRAHDGHVRSVAYPAASSSMVASAGPEMRVRIWHPATGQLRRTIEGATWPVSFSRYGDKIATGGPGHKVHLWDTETGELIGTVGQHRKPLTSIAISSDGAHLVTGSSDTLEQVWDLQSGELLRTLGGRVKPASPLVFAPDGTWLVAPTEAGSTLGACLWDIRSGRRIGSLRGHRGGPVHDVTVSWDGRYVATGGEDGTARIWDAKTGDELQLLARHTRPVRAVAFSPSGYRLATGSTDQTIQLWDATTGGHVMCITKRAAGIYDLAYSPDGRTLASGHGDGAIRIWKA
jgi:WD40 repeat protein